MQTLIKPTKVGFMKRELQIEMERSTEARFLIVSGILFFDTRAPEKLLSEQAFWPTAAEAFGEGVLFDSGMPKPHGEVLVAGEAVAPGGEPVRHLPVRFSVGPVRGDFRVFGERYWYHGENGLAASLPESFTRMPLTPNRAFGGAGHPKNPQGKGYGAEAVLENAGRAPLPNIERMLPPIALISDTPEPALLGPLAADDPERLKCAGTHDRHWLREVFPALPADYDLHAHMMAPPEFRHSGFFSGEETIFYQGFTEEPGSFLSALPRYAVRAFGHYRGEGKGLTEVKMRIDTIMLFASVHKAAIVFRGFMPYALDPVEEISHIMLASDELAGSGRDFEYYRSVFNCRSDPEEGYKYLLADGQLVPPRAMRPPSPEMLNPEEEFRDRLALLLEEHAMTEPGPLVDFIGPDKNIRPIPDLQLPSREDVEEGNIDLAPVIDQLTALQQETLAELNRVIDAIGERLPARFDKLNRLKDQAGSSVAPASDSRESPIAGAARQFDAALNEILETKIEDDGESRPEFTLLIDEALAALDVTDEEGLLSAPLKESIAEETAEAIKRADGRTAPGEADLLNLLSEFDDNAELEPVTPVAEAAHKPAAETATAAVDNAEGDPPDLDLDSILAMIEPAAPEKPTPENLQQTFEHGAQQLSDAIGTARRMSPEATFPEKPMHEETRKALGRHLLAKISEAPFGTVTAPLANADFAGASIASVTLESVDLTDIFLEKSTLEDITATAVRFRKTTLCEARWRTCEIAHSSFHGTNLSGAALEASVFSECRFEDLTILGTKLQDVHFRNCTFSDMALVECDFQTVRFDQCSFKNCQFIVCEMPETILSGCSADDVMVVECGLEGAAIRNLTAEKLVLVNCKLTKARFEQAQLSRFMIAGDKPADGVIFNGVTGKACGFNAAVMRNSALFRCHFEESSFAGCDLEGCDARLSSFTKSMLLKAKLEKADFFAANLFRSAMRGADLQQASLRGANLFECDMTDAKLAGCDLTHANLGRTLFEIGREL